MIESKIPEDIYVNSNSLMLGFILQNLVKNAINCCLNDELINIIAQRTENMAQVSILYSDLTSCADMRENPIAFANSTSVLNTNAEESTDTGLKLVKGFVSRQGGTIRFETEAAKGTRITFTLPEY